MSMPAIADAAAKDPVILAFGDSLTAGYGLKSEQSFPAQLQALLHKDGVRARVVNAGISGDTTAGGKARLNRVLAGLGRKPDLVILELGANDLLLGQDASIAEANLDAMLTELHRRGIPVILAGLFGSEAMGITQLDQYNAIYPRLARKHGAVLYPFFMKGVAFDRPLMLNDGLHPNARGVGIIAQNILPTVRAALKGL